MLCKEVENDCLTQCYITQSRLQGFNSISITFINSNNFDCNNQS